MTTGLLPQGHFSVRQHTPGSTYPEALSENLLIAGDALQVLPGLPERSVQTVVTSPPYWGLRDYGIAGQIGLNENLENYIAALGDVFDQVRRILRDDGTLWVNIGDAYTSGNRGTRAPDRKNPARTMSTRPATPRGLKSKDLIGLPWQLAFALQSRGWYLRSEVIWRKPNAQPESVQDRPTRDHEQIFLFSKQATYKYAVSGFEGPGGRRLRSVWDINTRRHPDAGGHFATFPAELVERCVLLSSDRGDLVLDPFLGSGTTAVAAGGLERRFLGVELHPEYVKLARRRLGRAGFADLPGESVAAEGRAYASRT